MFSPVYFNVFEFNTDSPAVRAKIINFNRANKKKQHLRKTTRGTICLQLRIFLSNLCLSDCGFNKIYLIFLVTRATAAV